MEESYKEREDELNLQIKDKDVSLAAS